MSKQDYELIAAVLRLYHDLASAPERADAIASVAYGLAQALAINPRFKTDKFLKAAVGEEKALRFKLDMALERDRVAGEDNDG